MFIRIRITLLVVASALLLSSMSFASEGKIDKNSGAYKAFKSQLDKLQQKDSKALNNKYAELSGNDGTLLTIEDIVTEEQLEVRWLECLDILNSLTVLELSSETRVEGEQYRTAFLDNVVIFFGRGYYFITDGNYPPIPPDEYLEHLVEEEYFLLNRVRGVGDKVNHSMVINPKSPATAVEKLCIIAGVISLLLEED